VFWNRHSTLAGGVVKVNDSQAGESIAHRQMKDIQSPLERSPITGCSKDAMAGQSKEYVGDGQGRKRTKQLEDSSLPENPFGGYKFIGGDCGSSICQLRRAYNMPFYSR